MLTSPLVRGCACTRTHAYRHACMGVGVRSEPHVWQRDVDAAGA